MKQENRVIARIFKYVRFQHSMTQMQFARQLGIHQSTLSRIERGQEYPIAPTVRKLETITGKKMLDMVHESRIALA